MNDQDRAAVVAFAEKTLGRLAGGRHEALRQVMLSAQAGPRSGNLEPSRGDRYEAITFPEGEHLVRVPPNDPTGEAAMAPDEASAALVELDKVLDRLNDVCRDLAALTDEWEPKNRPRLAPNENGPGPEWCSSCWRNNQTCEPVSERYRGLCRWCGNWKGEHGEIPPLPIVRARHRGERITSALVDRYTRRSA